jgi:hypothetical protein
MAIKNRTADQWHVLANQLFLDYVRTRLMRAPHAWGAFPVYGAGIWRTQQSECTRLAVARKNEFAEAMAGMLEMPVPADIRDVWANAMSLAESDITAHLAAS